MAVDDAINILCVHQGFELYGSDRMFIQSVKAFRHQWPKAKITIHLPQEGELTESIKPFANVIIIGDLFVLRRANIKFKNWKKLFILPRAWKRAFDQVKTHDVIYINTITIFSYLTVLPFVSRKKIIHAHEFLDKIPQFLLQCLINLSSPLLITNSAATNLFFDRVEYKRTVLNGLPKAFASKSPQEQNLRLVCIGRINAWKGQGLLVDALHELQEDGFKNITLDIVGDVFGQQDEHLIELQHKIDTYKLQERVILHGFQHDPNRFHENADICVVPSLRPEPFGLVAIEAMRAAMPVIAANHGGLKEIIVSQETGFFFIPNDAKSLAEMIRRYIVHPELIVKHGTQGQKVFEEKFTEVHYQDNFLREVTAYVA